MLTDYLVPGMDGVELIAVLKHILPSTPIIILTGDWSMEVYIKALSLGAFECLAKPVKAKDLGRAVKSALQQCHVGNAMLLS